MSQEIQAQLSRVPLTEGLPQGCHQVWTVSSSCVPSPNLTRENLLKISQAWQLTAQELEVVGNIRCLPRGPLHREVLNIAANIAQANQ